MKIDFNQNPEEVIKISDLKKMADYWLRQYLLVTTKRGVYGRLYCPFKKRWYEEKEMQVCHYIDRAIMRLRYDTRNCLLCSKQSNYWDSQVMIDGYKSKHHKDFEEYLGEEESIELEELSKELVVLHRQDYIDIINDFKNTLNGKK